MHPENDHLKSTDGNDDLQIICKNCEHTFVGNFCSQCGQSTKEFDRPLQVLFVDFAGNIFAFDTRVWRSLKHILFRPGKMETQYIAGKRIRYMPPFRMYVFVSFFFFLTLSYVTSITVKKNKQGFTVAMDSSHMQQEMSPMNRLDFPVVPFGDLSTLPDSVLSNISHIPNPSDTLGELSTGKNNGIKVGKNNIDVQRILDNPEFYMERFFKYFSWTLFVLMPIYGFLLWVAFRKSRKFYISHFLLSINHHVFVFLLVILILCVQLIFPSKSIEPENYLLYLFPIYAWLGAKKLYEKKWLSTSLRLVAVLFVYVLITAISAGLVFFATII